MEVKATRTDPTFTLTMSTDEAKMLVQILRYGIPTFDSDNRPAVFASNVRAALEREIQNAGVM